MNRAEAIAFAIEQREIFGGRMGEFLEFVESELTQTNASNTLNALHDDTISRQTAIDALLRNQEVYSNNFGTDAIDKYTIAIIDNDVQTIAQLPSAERSDEAEYWHEKCQSYEQTILKLSNALADRRGKWEEKWHSVFKEEIPCCSVCNNFMAFRWRFCPNCGARMEDEE